MKLLLRVCEGRMKGGNRGMGNHIERNLCSFLIASALFTSLVDCQYGTIAIPPAQRYAQAVFSSPSPQIFSIQLRRKLPGYFPAPSSLSTVNPPIPPPEQSQPGWESVPGSTFSEEVQGEKSNQVPVIVGSVIAGIVVFALIGVAIWWKCKKKPAEGDEEKPGAWDDIESTQRSPKEGHAIFLLKGMAKAYSMESQEAPAKAANGFDEGAWDDIKTFNEGACDNIKSTHRSPKQGNAIFPDNGMIVAYSMEAQEAPAKAANATAVAMTAHHHFTYNEILKITGKFGRVIGEGGTATVYYGQLQEGGRWIEVAVKKIKDSSSPYCNLLAEVKIMTNIHHRNLVSLVGLCEEHEIILVSEYMAGGSLFDILKDRRSELTWRKRLQIALEAATGLEYLHTGCKPAVIHRDIKSTNILLDENLEAKLADFGLSKAGAVDGSECSAYHTKIAGTAGYIDPEYLYTQTLTKKSDVYSFGVVLFELITGRPAIVDTESKEKLPLTNWVMPMIMRGEIESLLDPLLKGHCNIDSVWEVAGVAKTATQHPNGRPDMSDIVSTLKAALRMETSWSTSETITSQSSFKEVPLNPVAR